MKGPTQIVRPHLPQCLSQTAQHLGTLMLLSDLSLVKCEAELPPNSRRELRQPFEGVHQPDQLARFIAPLQHMIYQNWHNLLTTNCSRYCSNSKIARHGSCNEWKGKPMTVGRNSALFLSRRRSRVRAPSSPPFLSITSERFLPGSFSGVSVAVPLSSFAISSTVCCFKSGDRCS